VIELHAGLFYAGYNPVIGLKEGSIIIL